MNISNDIKELAESLALAQAEITSASKDRTNPHFGNKYADLASCWDACRVPLTRHGLSIVQLPSSFGQKVSVSTILLHKTGQFISSDLELTAVQNNPQAIGSAITYARRYALCATVGISPDDDDGNTASGGGSKAAAQAVAEKKLAKSKGAGPFNSNGEYGKPDPPEPVETTSDLERQLEASLKEAQGVDKFAALSRFAELKKKIISETGSDELYYGCLKTFGYKKANEIPPLKMRTVYKHMAEAYKAWKASQQSEEDASFIEEMERDEMENAVNIKEKGGH